MSAGTMLKILLLLSVLAPRIPRLADPVAAPVSTSGQGPQSVPGAVEKATLFSGGRIFLNDGKGTVAEALLASEGKVAAVGSLSDLAKLPEAKDCTRIDLAGTTAVPGIQDAHGHIQSYGASLENVDLRGCATFDEVVERVVVRAGREKEGVWIVGRGWDQNLWPEKNFPEHAKLSEKTRKNPVFLTRVDGHAALANRLALATAKLDREYLSEPKIQGGRVLLDAQRRPTGVLVDQAMDLVQKCIPTPSRAVLEARFLAAQEKLLAFGLTCVHDMGTTPEELDLLQALRARGQLRLRIVAYLAGTDQLTDEMVANLPLAPDDRDLLSCPGVKLIADGALGSRGAALLEDYSDAPGERGHLILDLKQLSAKVALCQKHGLQPAIHAIGDRANREVLDVYQTLETVHPSARELRPRIEHAQVVSLKDWPRFPELGVIPSMQPVHAISDMPWAVDRLGKERSRGAYAWRALAPELGRLAFGSDFPVESPDPLRGLFAAQKRSNPGDSPDQGLPADQRLDGAAALAGFTSGAAYACHQEDRRGRLLPGYGCDMTVLSVDPTTCEPDALLTAHVSLTVVNGEVVWRAK